MQSSFFFAPLRLCVILLILRGASDVALADDSPPADRTPVAAVEVPHAHRPVEVFGEPILTRLPVKLRAPRRLAVDPERRVLIADAAAGTVVRVSPGGEAVTLAEGLAEPVGLAIDSQGRLYVALRAGGATGAGSIIRLDGQGSVSTVLAGLNGPAAIAVDARDELHVACAGDGTILRVAPAGGAIVVAREIDSPSALIFHRGALHVASASKGTVIRIGADGRAALMAEGFTSPSDLATGPKGELIVCDEADTTLVALDAESRRSGFLSVPAGTRAIVFEADGNLIAASPRLQIAVRLTTQLSVLCPHCEQPIPLRIRPRKPMLDPAADPI